MTQDHTPGAKGDETMPVEESEARAVVEDLCHQLGSQLTSLCYQIEDAGLIVPPAVKRVLARYDDWCGMTIG